jgi:hypothetical protein
MFLAAGLIGVVGIVGGAVVATGVVLGAVLFLFLAAAAYRSRIKET